MPAMELEVKPQFSSVADMLKPLGLTAPSQRIGLNVMIQENVVAKVVGI